MADNSQPAEQYDEIWKQRHTAAHVLAQAVVEMFPTAKLAIGPPIEDGFYYDFDLPRTLTPEDLVEVASRMKRIKRDNFPLVRSEKPREEAIAWEEERGQPFKAELIHDLPEGETISFYTQGPFTDLCRGPHVESTGKIGVFKLASVAGAYWRGDEKRDQLQRIYGYLFDTQEEMDAHLARLEEAKRRDHKVLGKQLGLFANNGTIGPGLPLWLPKGATIRRVLERHIVDVELASGYSHVYTPQMAKVDLYKISGHWEHYQDGMFPVMKIENEEFVLRPMNCPHHIMIYQNDPHSYRDLPVRLAELGTMYRYEKSGQLSGLSRVRAMTLNDAHIFCREDQVVEEVKGCILMVEAAYRKLGITDYTYRLSLHDPNDKEKYVDNPELWERAEGELRDVFKDLGLPYYEAAGEAAFYGPKIDIQLRNMLGKEETVSTVQVDRHLPKQFGLDYTGEDGHKHQPVMIHRGIISTMERMVAFLIEHYAGVFPTWLAPVQAVVLPIVDRHKEYGQSVVDKLKAKGFRVELDARNEKVGKKVAESEVQKIPYMLVVGDRDAAAGTVSVRLHGGTDLGAIPLDDFIARLVEETA
ncbi:threonine--tRNA ligase 1 [Capsulimonas corticalis]|uniref:Threonine--tRNA ligase n=1 Tax=Capsulimonas corticalis TaxID=2219043 RepID=A0A402CZU3_9BACT|nr:threonine--tRNA ligase [Capsulimonas corticalis]BDI33834.1 threonine--tRNA ligase 1 [Capsulimonas corticalis]